MSKIKSLILGSAAGFVAIAGAQAADLPVKAKAVQYVKICSLYGAGFYYMPGTDTCIKLGGYVQFDANINGGNYNKPAWDTAQGFHDRNADYFTSRSRASFNVDTRTATEYGVVRTYWSSNFQHSTGDGPSSGVLTTDFAFVQFAGFTFGKAISGFQTPWGAYGANNNTSFLLGGYDDATGVTQVAYTWQFGNGVSAQIGVEDNRGIYRGQLINTGVAGTNTMIFTGNYGTTSNPTGNGYGGNTAPDIVGNIKIDQAAFTAQLSAAAHSIHANSYTGDERFGAPSDKWGFAVQGGLQLKNLPTGPGDKLSVSAIYADGAIRYIIGGVTGTAFTSFSGGDATSYNTFAAFPAADGMYGPGGSIQTSKAWGVQAAFVHAWSPTWESSLFGSYSSVDLGGTGSLLCSGAVATVAGTTRTGVCNPNFNIAQVGLRTAWTPVQNLTFSAEVLYTLLDTAQTGTVTPTAALNAGSLKPFGVPYAFKDQDIVSGNLRVRRTF